MEGDKERLGSREGKLDGLWLIEGSNEGCMEGDNELLGSREG